MRLDAVAGDEPLDAVPEVSPPAVHAAVTTRVTATAAVQLRVLSTALHPITAKAATHDTLEAVRRSTSESSNSPDSMGVDFALI